MQAAKELSSEAKALSRSREILEQMRMEKYERLYAALGGGWCIGVKANSGGIHPYSETVRQNWTMRLQIARG